MADALSVSGTNDAYNLQGYTVEANEKNTLSMTDFFKLLATQLQNQDTSNPMETSEMMAQLTQMGMMQAMSSMTTAIDTSTNVTAQTYAAGLIGQEITVAVTEEQGGIDVPVGVKYAKVEYISFVNGSPEEQGGIDVPVGVKYAKVEYISFVNGSPVLKVEGDKKEYPLAHVLGVGRIPDPYAEPENPDEDGENGDKVEGDGEGGAVEGDGASGDPAV